MAQGAAHSDSKGTEGRQDATHATGTRSLILQRNKPRKRNLAEESGWWKATAGNTANNWSPYPDRYLDARTIKYPIPKKTLERHRLPGK